MTDKLHCPFCSEEIFVAHETMCVCKNDKCRAWGCAYPKFILTALIDGKKAQDALKEIANYTYFIGETDMKWHVRHLMNIARKAITKQGE